MVALRRLICIRVCKYCCSSRLDIATRAEASGSAAVNNNGMEVGQAVAVAVGAASASAAVVAALKPVQKSVSDVLHELWQRRKHKYISSVLQSRQQA
jgi:uncharacterized membrane protein